MFVSGEPQLDLQSVLERNEGLLLELEYDKLCVAASNVSACESFSNALLQRGTSSMTAKVVQTSRVLVAEARERTDASFTALQNTVRAHRLRWVDGGR